MRRVVLLFALGAALGGSPRAAVAQPGGTWEVQASGVEDHLNDVTFVSDRVGWAIGGHNTILHTADGGKTWARQVDRQDKGPTFHRVLFTGPKAGWVSTEILGTILHTADGGATWEKVPLPSPRAAGVSYTQVAAVGDEFLLQYAKFVFRTADAGRTWDERTHTFPADSLAKGGMWFADPSHGCAAWNAGRLAVTADGGRTWAEGRLGAEAGGPYTLARFADPKAGWALPEHGTIHATTDGRTWAAQDLGAGQAGHAGRAALRGRPAGARPRPRPEGGRGGAADDRRGPDVGPVGQAAEPEPRPRAVLPRQGPRVGGGGQGVHRALPRAGDQVRPARRPAGGAASAGLAAIGTAGPAGNGSGRLLAACRLPIVQAFGPGLAVALLTRASRRPGPVHGCGGALAAAPAGGRSTGRRGGSREAGAWPCAALGLDTDALGQCGQLVRADERQPRERAGRPRGLPARSRLAPQWLRLAHHLQPITFGRLFVAARLFRNRPGGPPRPDR